MGAHERELEPGRPDREDARPVDAGAALVRRRERDPVQWVEVVESSQQQRFELEVTQEALDRALARAPF